MFEKEDLVIYRRKNIFRITLTILIAVVVTGCDVFAPAPTPTPVPTNTPLPTDTPVPTETPLPPTPTFTETLMPSPTSSPIPFTPPTLAPTATVDPNEAIRIYYVYFEEEDEAACNGEYRWVSIGVKRSEDVVGDLKLALYRLLTYYQPYWGQLYHAGYASQLAVGSVEIDANRTAFVNLTGTYVPTKNQCDASWFKDQIKMTIKQFPLVASMVITINGHPIADVMSRKK